MKQTPSSSYSSPVPHNRSYSIINNFSFVMASIQDFDLGPDPTLLQVNNEQTNALKLSASSPRTWRSQLGVDFQPSEYSVICGRGKTSYDHTGNHRLRVLAGMFVENYSLTGCNKHKSAMTRERGGSFCKYEQGAWFEVGDHFAREKVSAMFRDMLHTQYRSSAKAKTARRRVQIKRIKTETQQQHSQQLIDGIRHWDESSMTSSRSGSSRTDSLGFNSSLKLDFFDIEVFEV
jgi:hypothetical protein